MNRTARLQLAFGGAALVALIVVMLVLGGRSGDSGPKGSADPVEATQAQTLTGDVVPGRVRDDRYRSSLLETVVPKGSRHFNRRSGAGYEQVTFQVHGFSVAVRAQPAVAGEGLSDLAGMYRGDGKTQTVNVGGRRVLQVTTKAGGNSGALLLTFQRGRLLTVMAVHDGTDVSAAVRQARKVLTDSRVVAPAPG